MQKADRYNLTTGGIIQKLVALALPIMGTNFVQMAYNLADMFWLGRLGSTAVAASGTVGLFMWLAMALQHFGVKGAEIGVAQNIGGGKPAAARGFAQSAISLAALLGVAFGAFLMIFRVPLIGFFQITDADVVRQAEMYLLIIGIGIPFTYVTSAITGTFNASGNSAAPFVVNAVALGLNIVLDPLLIFSANLGIAGAAIATVTAQVLCCVFLVMSLKRYQHSTLASLRLFSLPKREHLRQIFRWATPIVLESLFFTLLVMVISRFVASFGADAIAIQRIGSQAESMSWLIAGGFGSAFTAFVGQNYGGGFWRRIHKGFSISMALMVLWGAVVTASLFFGAEAIFLFFLPGEAAIATAGAYYMRILASFQIVGCLEPLAAGAFRGMGRTLTPSVISITVNVGRVGLAYVLSQTALGINGIWWALCIGAAARGLFVFIAYFIARRRMPKHNIASE